MKILAASDAHNDLTAIERLAEKAEKENVDLVVLAGDMINADEFKGNIISPFLKRNQKVIFVPGNHESFATADFISSMYKIKNLHTQSAVYQNIGFFGCGGTNIGLSQLSEEEIFGGLNKTHAEVSHLDKKVMITHVHPTGSIAENMTRFFPGSEGVRKAIDTFKPDIAICGHVHEAEGIEEVLGSTKVINVGKDGQIIYIN